MPTCPTTVSGGDRVHQLREELEGELLGPEPSLGAAAWPEAIDTAAYHGLAGDYVRIVQLHSEADPVALLIQFLVMFGGVVGRNAHFDAEADHHFGNLFTCFVGPTSKGRKGTSYGRVRDLFAQVDGIGRGTGSGQVSHRAKA